MASIDKIRASDGSGNASVATVQSTRSSGATTISVDTVLGINGNFMGTMGTPHTFTDPVTSETITVISEATAVDFAGHVDGSNLEIDDIAPGYTDNGSEVGDIVVIRPTSQWADNVADILEVVHNDDGTLKDGAVDGDVIPDNSIELIKLITNIFGGAVNDYTNTGTAGGSFHYINLGGIKLLWGKTASKSVGTGGATWTVDISPASFTTIQSSMVTLDLLGTTGTQHAFITGLSNSTLSIGQISTVNGSSQTTSVLIIGK